MKENNAVQTYKLKDFIPLFIIAAIILILTLARQVTIITVSFYPLWLYPWSINIAEFCYDFMGFFFLVFGAFKLCNLNKFASAYAMYDPIAHFTLWYGYVYPFIELSLGLAYLLRWQLTIINWFTLFLMSYNALAVGKALIKGEHLMCACLGMVFKLPMTYVTLAEDLLMAIMALLMLML